MQELQRQYSQAEQGTPEWLASRIGYVTASNLSAVLAKGSGVTRKNYMVKMLCESLSGKPTVGYKSDLMQDGNDNEATARLAYEFATGNYVDQLGFCYIPDLMLGASTDGVTGDGLIEIKNVKPAIQLDFIETGKIKREYLLQMQTQMFVLDKQWCDFVSQSLGNEEEGELPERYKLKVVRVKRDEEMISEILKETAKFHIELQELIVKLERLTNEN